MSGNSSRARGGSQGRSACGKGSRDAGRFAGPGGGDGCWRVGGAAQGGSRGSDFLTGRIKVVLMNAMQSVSAGRGELVPNASALPVAGDFAIHHS